MKILAVIPARMGSNRFPGKPMADLAGKPMIQHVYERVVRSSCVNMTVVATCDRIIFDHILSIGGKAVLTSDLHERASDRAAEALIKVETESSEKFDICVMVQGDEPMTHPRMIDQAVAPMLEDSTIDVVNLMGEGLTESQALDPNTIKVVVDRKKCAIYFSRSPIPYGAATREVDWKKQICIIPFRRDVLIEFNNLTATPLEIIESIDMLRLIEHGYKVQMVATEFETHAVDTPSDLLLVESLMKEKRDLDQF